MNRIAAIGVFDGVHQGHRYVLDRLKSHARRYGLKPMVVTFDPCPQRYFRSKNFPGLITPVAQRRSLIEKQGIDVLILPFDDNLRRQTAGEFLRYLHEHHQVERLLLGYDQRFGSDALPSTYAYAKAAQNAGIKLTRLQPRPRTDVTASSTAIRRALSQGDIGQAASLLGRPYTLSGTVVHGQGLAKKLGYPTANLHIDSEVMLPKTGVYVATALDDSLTAVVNIGHRPTVEAETDAPITIEAHIIDYQGPSLYGKELTLSFISRLRNEQHFTSLEQLTAAISADIAAAKALSIDLCGL